MYCTGGIRCERGSAYLKAKVGPPLWGTAGMEGKAAPPAVCGASQLPLLPRQPARDLFSPCMVPAQSL